MRVEVLAPQGGHGQCSVVEDLREEAMQKVSPEG